MAEFSKLKVLIIDDDLNIRKIIKTVLSSLGVKDISEAVNGKEAYDLLKVPKATLAGGGRKKYDLIICDWVMPVMSGVELLTKIRQDTFLKTTYFLMATAENEADSIMKAIQQGVDDYIVKPFTAKVLEDKLKAVAQKIGISRT